MLLEICYVKLYQNILQNAPNCEPFQKIFSVKHAPEPPSYTHGDPSIKKIARRPSTNPA